MIIGTSLISYELLAPAYFYYFVLRMKKVNPLLQPKSDWKIAMVATKAPSEPWHMVERTLLAMLEQEVKHDTWLADEEPTEETLKWCEQNGINVSCRKNIREYHNRDWPRRTKCKEGNLAYFYDNYGYNNYDIVCQLDADHAPSNGYLREMVLPFLDESIGYVAAPSICDNNKDNSWSARGRLYAEATLHGPLQAGYNRGWAPLCIGSHYAVRTSALKQIGGIGPELAEDHSTSLIMNSHGWKGAFQIDAIANGDGPQSFSDCMTQEFQWSRSLTTILLKWTPRYWRSLGNRKKFQFAFSQLWYPIFCSVTTIGYAVLLYCLLFDKTLANISYWKFALFTTCIAIAYTLPAICLKDFGVLRPAYRPVFSWEEPLFTISRYPWVCWGIIQGLITSFGGESVVFRVTPKGEGRANRLPLRNIMPYAVLIMIIASILIVRPSLIQSPGYYILALASCSFLAVGLFLIFFLHHHENGIEKRTNLKAIYLAIIPSTALLLFAAILRAKDGFHGLFTPTGGTHLNSKHDGSQFNGYMEKLVSNQGSDNHGQDNRSQATSLTSIPCTKQAKLGVYDTTHMFDLEDKRIDILHDFIPWGQFYTNEIGPFLLRTKELQKTPLLTLEFWPWALFDKKQLPSKGEYDRISRQLLFDIANGFYDAQILSSLDRIRRSGNKVVLVRIMHEMELTRSYPWYTKNSDLYIQAYRHVVSLSRANGIENIKWVWSPAGNKEAVQYWPGDSYVDIVGISVYAHPDWTWGHADSGKMLSFKTLMKWKYWVSDFNKPIIIAELGASGPGRKEWLTQAAIDLDSFKNVTGVVYYNQVQPSIVPIEIGSPDWSLKKDESEALTSKFCK